MSETGAVSNILIWNSYFSNFRFSVRVQFPNVMHIKNSSYSKVLCLEAHRAYIFIEVNGLLCLFYRAVFNAVTELQYVCLVSPHVGALGEELLKIHC